MNRSLLGFSYATLQATAMIAAMASVAAAAPYQEGYVRLRIADGNGTSLARQLDGSVESNAGDGSRTIYSVRMNATRALLDRCESGTLHLEYLAVPVYIDRRSGAVVHPNTQLIASLFREMSGAAVERVEVPFTFDASGRFEARDSLSPNACLVPDARMAVNCGIKWKVAARVDCD